MPVTPTYPGLYIEELPSSAHTITAAPTSIAVFIGYTHPFKMSLDSNGTPNFGKPLELFSFSDYERLIGGFFSNAAYDADADKFGSVAHAVNQFFLNGGAICHVVGLPPSALVVPGTLTKKGTPDPKAAILFTAREPTDGDHTLTVTIDNLNDPDNDTADITLTYGEGPGSVFEKFRGVKLGASPDIEARIGTAAKPVSSLVTVQPLAALDGTGAYPAKFSGKSSDAISDSPLHGEVSAVTNATPIVITSKTPHGLVDGQTVNIAGVGGNNAANGTFIIKRVDPTKFSLKDLKGKDVAGTGAYTTGGIWSVSLFSASDFTGAIRKDGPLDKLSIFNLLTLPGVTDNGVLSASSKFCEQKMAMLIIDPPKAATPDGANGTNSIADVVNGNVSSLPAPPLEKNCALYFPYIKSTDPVTGQELDLPPSGTVAGIFSRTDLNRGVWKAPAGLETTINNTTGVVETGRMNDLRQGVLNPLGVNCLRDFPGTGTVVFGARTLVTNNPALRDQWRYVPVRRMALFLEQTLLANLGWVVFEPNDEPLWIAIRSTIESFMLGLFRQGAFQGAKPSEAFLVKCDEQTTTQADIDNGIVNIIVAFAPLKPAEFVIIKIAQLAGQAQN
jgi:phage tail sheath protein FI